MPAIALPRMIEEKFEDLSRQVRRLWLVRGLSRVVIVAILAALAAILADCWFPFNTTARWIVSLAWLAIMALSIWQFVITSFRRKLTTTELAHAIETQFPSLSERLMTLVELRDAQERAHGSKPLMDVLIRETSHRTKRLDFDRAAPRGSTIRGGLVAGMLITIVVVSLAFISGAVAGAKRFLLPWHSAAVETPFAIRVSSGNVIVKRGEPVTLTGYLERRQPEVVLPAVAVLIARDRTTQAERKLPMTGDTQAAFHLTWPAIAEDFDYRIEAGTALSEWYSVAVTDPVELSEGSTVTVTPPAYAVPPFTTTVTQLLPAIDGIQHSRVELKLKFNRPAASVSLDLLANSAATIDSEHIPVTLSEDRRSATAQFPLISLSTLRLILTAEQGLKTTLTTPVKTTVDAPPRFEKAVGISDRVKSVKPDESIILELMVSDDVKVESLVLEYEVNRGATIELPIKHKDLGSPRADVKHVFALAGLVKDGDLLKYRLKASDNRRVAGLKPQVAYFPERAWASLKIAASAESLDQQDILAQRDAIQKKLEVAKVSVNDSRKLTEQVQRASAGKPMLSPEQVAKLQQARDVTEAVAKLLDDTAKDASLTPELRGFAEALRSTVRDTVQAADDLLRRSSNEPTIQGRSDRLQEAEQKLMEARSRIEDLEKRNADLARNRLDKRRLEKLADEVSRLAADAEAAIDSKAREEFLKKLHKAQEELRDIVRGNDALRAGAENAADEQARKLADEAGKLRDAQRKLSEDVARTEADARHKALERAAKAQDELSAKADALRDRTAVPSRLTGSDPLARAPFDAAGSKLRDGEPVEAMTEQEKAARDLERLAGNLEKSAKDRQDPREAARQLAKLQEELRTRFEAAMKKPLSEEVQKRFATQQDAIRKALDQIETPPDDVLSPRDKAAALEKLKTASDAVDSNPQDAAEAQQAAADALKRFADKLPPRSERLKQGLTELEKLMREQEQLARDIEEKLKPYERRKPDDLLQESLKNKLADLAKLQAKLAETLSAIDTPGYVQRRQRTVNAAMRASEDLQQGLPQDIPASQQNLRQRLSQLRAALSGNTPSDAVADELASLQNDIKDRLARGELDASQLGELQKLQREVADRIGGIKDPDGAERLIRAKASAIDAARQFQNANNLEELRKKSEKAAMDLDELADHLAGVEADRERIERLAKSRSKRAEWSKENAGKAVPPETAASIANELERDLADLKRTRAGTAQSTKKNAIEALERLMRTPNAERASSLQQDAVDALGQLAQGMAGASDKRGERIVNDGDSSGDANGQLPSKSDAAAARALAEEQRALRDQVAKDAAAGQPDAKATEEQSKVQKTLAGDAAELARRLEAAAHASTHGEANATKLTEAAESAKKAKEQMEKAFREQSANRSAAAGEARKQAGKSLEEAMTKADSAAGNSGKTPDPSAAVASKSAEEASGKMREAGQQPGQEADPLKKAAEKISKAADSLGEAGKNPGVNDGNKSMPLTSADLPADLQQYAGKPWGDLPGDVKVRIIQDLKSKYGEDYARAIKLYFEQLAEKN